MQHLCCFYLLAISVGICQPFQHNFSMTEEFKGNILQPPIPYRPFVSVWNVDSNRCLGKFHVNIDLSSFDIIHNPNEQYVGDNMVIFYAALLGLYPKYDPNGNPVNGGIPQNGNISAHYEKCVVDLEQRMPDPEYSGIAVIDWEAWRPLWERNGWGSGLIYQNNSIAKVKNAHPNWPMHKIISQAKSEFEKAAKNYMLGTLNLVRLLRPKAKWGYYLFPDCYNYDKTGKDLTCHSSTISDNNDIEWLFDASTALYPSTYLGLWFKNTEATLAYVGNRVKEAMRVDFNRKSGTSVPVYVYNNIVYRRSNELLTMKDVIDSSGLASVLGSSGVVFWGDSRISESKETCEELKYYVEQLLGPYMKQASDSATECSIQSCSGHGRCVMSTNSSHKVENAPKSFLSFLNTTVPTDVKYDVCCQCYDGFTGSNCQHPTHVSLSFSP